MNKLLYPLSFIYEALSKADKALKKPQKFSKPVISVGNLTWGGTGKTPIVIELAKFIIAEGKKPVILTRGYGRKSKNPILLKDGGAGIDIKESGDEAMLIAKSVPQADIIIGSNRYENALKFQGETQADIYILDDGFQHWKIKRDLDIVCINAANPFGNGLLIPAGILRERIFALKRADLIIITNADMASPQQLENIKQKINPFYKKEFIISQYGGYEIKKLNLIDNFDIQTLKSCPIYALSAIGFAEGFQNSLKKAGIEIKNSFKLKDHHSYSLKNLQDIYKQIEKAAILMITAKDAVKIAQIADEQIQAQIAVLTVKADFQTGRQIWQTKISNILASF
ncbi:MAG: tetraacyldisaccharide 4'-kinase [Elusimicrobiota bacterium]|jgi:tetraacyldisaccharide 4'-kinase|nr:tetraacyldisaccharide 4'-kinase [Elusimicrobiota bacterium]